MSGALTIVSFVTSAADAVNKVTGLSVSDWVQIACTLFLGLAAFFTPLLTDLLKKWWWKPKLKLEMRLSPPSCHITDLIIALSDAQKFRRKAYYFRFLISNNGKSQARKCEVTIESLEIMKDGKFELYPRYTPVSLVWGSGNNDFVDINPGRHFYCDFISVPDHEAQNMTLPNYIDLPSTRSSELGAVLLVRIGFNSQPNRLHMGKYRIAVAVYSENAKTIRLNVIVSWSGIWRETEQEMFKELSIHLE